MKKQKKMREQSAITLIALVVTIVVLIIIASISIGVLTGDSGIIKQAQKGKESAEISEEKEIIEISVVQAIDEDVAGNIDKQTLQTKLNNNAGDKKTEVIDNGDTIVVKFVDNERYYEIDSNGNIEKINIIRDSNPGNITIGINGETLSGTEESPFEIWCIEDLIEWSKNYLEYQNSFINLCLNLNFKLSLSYADSSITSYGDINKDGKVQDLLEEMQGGEGFTPIEFFAGVFNGQKFKIENIYICRERNAGLFLALKGEATVKKLEISGYIYAANGYTVGIVSTNQSGSSKIDNCINRAEITAENKSGETASNGQEPGSAGGIAGSISSYIINCHNYGKVYGVSKSGGIQGYKYSGGTNQYLNCSNYGEIQGEGDCGGILGCSIAGTVEMYNCYNMGIINSSTVGGLYGFKGNTTKATIKNSFNFGQISGTTNTGEIIGYNWAYTENTSPVVNNVYYFNNSNKAFGTSQQWVIGEAQYYDNILNSAFIDILNDYITENAENTVGWKKWIKGKDGYPTFE